MRLIYNWYIIIFVHIMFKGVDGLRTVTPLPAKNAGFEVMVQGSQIALVTKHLMSKGVAKEWVESADMTKKKK